MSFDIKANGLGIQDIEVGTGDDRDRKSVV